MSDAFVPGTFSDSLPRPQSNFAFHDPAQWLPPSAQEKLLRLQQDFNDKRQLLPDWDERHLASTEKLAAAQRLKRLLDHPQQGGFGLGGDHLSVVVARREAERTAAASARTRGPPCGAISGAVGGKRRAVECHGMGQRWPAREHRAGGGRCRGAEAGEE